MEKLQMINIDLIQDKDSELLFRDELQLLYGLHGDIRAEVMNDYYELSGSGILLINPYEPYRINCGNAAAILIRISQDVLKMADASQNSYFRCFISDDSSGKQGEYDMIRVYIAQLFQLFYQDSNQRKAQLITCTLQLFNYLTEHFNAPQSSSLRNEKSGNTRQRYINTMRYIHENWKEPISIQMLAQREFVSVGYMSHLFKQFTGTSVTEYIAKLRLQHAEKDLMNTDQTVTEIALSNGFKNTNAFIEKFRKQFHSTPKQYQRLMKQRLNKTPINWQGSTEEAIATLLNYTELDYLSASEQSIPSEYRSGVILAAKAGKKLKHTWRRLLNIGYAKDGLLSIVQDQIRKAQRDIGFEYIRFHGIFDDDMYVYYEDEQGNPRLDFSRVDMLLDFILSVGLKPYLELSYMPSLLANNKEKIYSRATYMTTCSDEKKWSHLVGTFVQHCVERYGRKQVLEWRFTTIGNFLCSFGVIEQEDYLKIYQTTFESIKSVDKRICFGGPSGIGSPKQSKYVQNFFEYVIDNHCVPDFISTQCYPYVDMEEDKEILGFVRTQNVAPVIISENEHYTQNMLQEYRECLKEFGLNYKEIWIDEWNSNIWQRDASNDTCFKASWLAMNISENYDNAEAFGYWLLTDYVEEWPYFHGIFHGGLGLLTYNGIPKSGWSALQLIRMLGDELIASGQGWIATKKHENIQILLTHYAHYDAMYRLHYKRLTDNKQAYSIFVKKGKMNYSLQIDGIKPGRYRVQEYSVTRQKGSSFDDWMKIGAPEYLNAPEVTYLQDLTQPQYYIETKTLESRFHLESTLDPHDVKLILITAADE